MKKKDFHLTNLETSITCVCVEAEATNVHKVIQLLLSSDNSTLHKATLLLNNVGFMIQVSNRLFQIFTFATKLLAVVSLADCILSRVFDHSQPFNTIVQEVTHQAVALNRFVKLTQLLN
jgi:hypothetical protein